MVSRGWVGNFDSAAVVDSGRDRGFLSRRRREFWQPVQRNPDAVSREAVREQPCVVQAAVTVKPRLDVWLWKKKQGVSCVDLMFVSGSTR